MFLLPSFLRAKFAEPQQQHDLVSRRVQRGWTMNGAMAEVTATLDPDKLELTHIVKGHVKTLPFFNGIDADFYGDPCKAVALRVRLQT